MFIHFHLYKEFQKERFSCSRIVMLKFLNMFNFVWVEPKQFTDNFVHLISRYAHSTCDRQHVLCVFFILASSTPNATSIVSTEAGFLPFPGSTDNKPMASNFAIIFLKPCSVVDPRRIPLTKRYLCKAHRSLLSHSS